MNTSSSVPALEICGLSLAFRGIPALTDIDLELPDGEFLGIIGPNGGGKTVLLKSILGLIKPDRGTVRVFGRPPEAARDLVAYVPQFARFDPNFPIRVEDVVLMGRLQRRRLGRPYTKEDREEARAALAQVEMQDLARRQIGKLSGGQLQRVLIARALAVKARILLLDEPTASLDTRIGRDFYNLLSEVARGMTVILVSHDIGVVNRYVSSVACLNREMHYHGTKEITQEMIEATYGCPVDFVIHPHVHRVLPEHETSES